MNANDRLNTIARIIDRADALGIARGDRITKVLDIENADKQFALRFEDWLSADDMNFAHDFTGIQANMNRMTGAVENLFVPRFAGEKQTKTAQMEYIARTLTAMTNRLTLGDPIEITYRRETEESVKDYTDWGRQRFGIHPGLEYFYVWRGEMLYAVDVTADSPLTGAHELMDLLARKF